MSENQVHGLEDAFVSEMIKKLPLEKIYVTTRCFQERFMGQVDAPSSWILVKLVFLQKPDAEPHKGIRSYRAIAVTSVMSNGTHLALFFVWKRKEPESWKKLHVGRIEGISCQHLQVIMTELPC